jgi:hypothetical protein
MSLQIRKIILYSKHGAIRELPFELGRLNIITEHRRRASPPSSTSLTIAPAGASA